MKCMKIVSVQMAIMRSTLVVTVQMTTKTTTATTKVTMDTMIAMTDNRLTVPWAHESAVEGSAPSSDILWPLDLSPSSPWFEYVELSSSP